MPILFMNQSRQEICIKPMFSLLSLLANNSVDKEDDYESDAYKDDLT